MSSDKFRTGFAQRARQLDRLNLSRGFVRQIMCTMIGDDKAVDELEIVAGHLFVDAISMPCRLFCRAEDGWTAHLDRAARCKCRNPAATGVAAFFAGSNSFHEAVKN
jgi:hypothetical protein